MEQKLLAYFSKILPLSQEEIDAIVATLTIKIYPKGSVLLSEGEISSEAYFVLDGCVRQYFLVDGEEKTNNFFTEEQWVISMQSMTYNSPSKHFLACIDECTLVVGNREKEELLYSQFPKLATISRKVMEKVFAEQQELSGSYFTDTPEERYLNLIHTRPELLQRVPQYIIASYIGVKPESLSRIRNRLWL
ncbi:Crp/Fnr family transcriptional regulator [Fluviicola taffensis]|uniref:Putative transcriptional regulator, Crp/Fnr family n=1 Tax=Fluviicola taffensis (strain DSM 16823 / NCIMB 13979 / RW262) TaxID=755732 RepID=F2IB21_FLUTR|nr:Crp/Fnr family transcriptional regulator [Fluviicola taffensis]AEA42104.1 putative transcriptional regulator, Crp/Fnr family [Fluviicola taffensis DSM 16823]